MTTPHPNREVLIALAEGKAVQFRAKDTHVWYTWRTELDAQIGPLSTSPLIEWRVKPEPIERWLAIWSDGKENVCKEPILEVSGYRVIHLREVE